MFRRIPAAGQRQGDREGRSGKAQYHADRDQAVQAVNADPQLNASVVRLMQLKAAVDNYESTRQEERRERQAGEEARSTPN